MRRAAVPAILASARRRGNAVSEPGYLHGFWNEHETEALEGALPVGRRTPRRLPYGLYAEQLSGSAFTAPRASNLRSWLYRIRPSVKRGRLGPFAHPGLETAPLADAATPAEPLRWDPFPVPERAVDWLDGLATIAANGDARLQLGIGIHVYAANRSMTDRFFYDADGELLLVPQQGRLHLHTECGVLHAAPGDIALIPRGIVFRVELPDGPSRGYVCENYGEPLRLPERGPVGSDGFANQRDFQAPVAAYEDREGEFELAAKLGGRLFSGTIGHSPLDVVAWYGNYAPYRYELARFNAMGSVGFDQPDPSIFTVLTSPSATPGTANVDFVVFPPRWIVGEDTFRPPPFHRNVMSEFMGLIRGVYDARPSGFEPGGASLHNALLPHGPAPEVHDAAVGAEDPGPQYLDDMLAFMLESRYMIEPTRRALEATERQRNYHASWAGIRKRF